MDKQLAGQRSTLYMLLKIHPSAKNKIIKVDEYKLLTNQIDRLAEVMDRMNTRSQDRQNQQNGLISLTSIEAEAEVCHSNYCNNSGSYV